MTRRRHTPEQVIRKLREADRLLGEGQDDAGGREGSWRSRRRPITGGATSTAG